MSNHQVNKVDLSLDDIIKLNKKGQKQDRSGSKGSNGNRGSRGNAQRHNNQGRGGVGPLNRKPSVSYRGQRSNLRGRVRGSIAMHRGGSGGARGGSLQRNTGLSGESSTFRGSLGGLRRGATRGARGGSRGHMHQGGGMYGFGGRQGQGPSHGQGQVNRLTLKQKRLKATQALLQARKTIAQLDQQQARQNFVNARRGILQQPQLVQPSMKQEPLYSSTSSLASTGSFRSNSSSRSLQGTKITAFTSPKPERRRRWRQNKSPAPGLGTSSSTLTISFDNVPSHTSFATPQVSTAPSRQRRRQWRRSNNTTTNNNNNHYSNNNVVSRSPSSSGSSYDDLDDDLSRGASAGFSQQLAKLKPTVSTKYVFQKRVFATGNTSYSLNDRFSSSSPLLDDAGNRKVYM